MLHQHRDAGHPRAVSAGVWLCHGAGGGIGVLRGGQGDHLARVSVIEVSLRLPRLIGGDDCLRLLKGPVSLLPAVRVGGEGDEPALPEQAVVGPVGEPRPHGHGPRPHGDGVDQKHHRHKDGQGQRAVGHHPVDLVGDGGGVLGGLLLHRLCHHAADVVIPLVGDDGLRVVVQLPLAVGDVLLQV